MAAGRWLRIVGGALLPAALLVGIGGVSWWRLRAPGPLPEAKAIVVPAGSTANVAQALARAGAIREPRIFSLAAFATSRAGTLHAGEFRFPEHASYRTVLRVLRQGREIEHHVTIPEGLTARQIVALLEKTPALVGTVSIPSEGYVLPDTYDFLYGTKRQRIVSEAHSELENTLAKLWAKRAPDLPLKTPEEALVLASIVERETALPVERPRIAAVFLNRLARGMALDADPTIIYAASDGAGELPGPITEADLETESPYNTYHHKGLPPGPIDAPGVASITAVLHPAASEDLYFVADGTGGHVFAKTLAGQSRNVARWRAIEAAEAAAR